MVAGFPPRALFVLADRSPPRAGTARTNSRGGAGSAEDLYPAGLWIERLGRVADQHAVRLQTSMTRAPSPYQPGTSRRCQGVAFLSRVLVPRISLRMSQIRMGQI